MYELCSASFGCVLVEGDILHMDVLNVFEVFELNLLGILHKGIYRNEGSLSSDGWERWRA